MGDTMTKYLFHGGPLDGTQRATGGCNPYTLRRGQRQHFVYQLHHYAAGPTRRYGLYVLRGNPPPNVVVMRELINKHMLEPDHGVRDPAPAPAVYVADNGTVQVLE